MFGQAKLNSCKTLKQQTHDLTPQNNRNDENKIYGVTGDSDIEVYHMAQYLLAYLLTYSMEQSPS